MVFGTATGAAPNGLRVAVRVDGTSSTEPHAERYVAWHLALAPGVSAEALVARMALIAF